MRALLIGDIHTEHELLAAALACGAAAGVDKVLSVGDIVDGPNDPLACIALLAGADVVRGNHERWVVEGHPREPFDYPHATLEWLAALPATREYATPTGRLLLGHGIGTHDMARLHPDTDGYALECLDLRELAGYRWFVGGHTHVPMVRTIGKVTIINPGTLVLDQDPGCMIADFATSHVGHWSLLPTVTRIASWQL